MLKVEPSPDYPTEEGRYLRGNDFSPVAVVVVLIYDDDKIPKDIETLVRTGVEAGAAIMSLLKDGVDERKKIRNTLAPTPYLFNLPGQFLKLRQRKLFQMRRPVHHLEIAAHKSFFGQIRRQRLQFHFTRRALFQLLNLQLRLGEFFLADFYQLRPFLIFGQKRFQRQVVGLHGLDDALELFQSLFKRWTVPGRIICPD